jgi:hypothetical protein
MSEFISIRKNVRLAEIPAAYLIEEDEDDYSEVPEWPQKQVARPSVSFLVNHYAPPMKKPEPLDPKYPKQVADNKVASEAAAKAVADAEVAYAAKTAELAKAEADNKTVNKWSSSRATSAALIKRLQGEAAELAEKKKKLIVEFERAWKSGEYARFVVASHAKSEERWESYKKLIHADWEANYGKHRPLRTSNDLFGYYDIVKTPEVVDNYTCFIFKAGIDVEHVARELQIGGHERVYCGGSAEEPWVEVLTSALHEFEKK